MMMGVKISVVGVLDGTRASTLRSEMVGSSGIEISSLGGWSGTVSYDPVASKYPCWSSFHLSGGRRVRGQPVAGPKSFTTGGTLDPSLCENIKDTLGKSIII
jgi:hypothetical protein